MKTVCIYHSIDLDGWMSAAIVKHWFKKTNDNYTVIDEADKDGWHKIQNTHKGDFTTKHNSLEFIGYNYGQPIPDLSEYDKVIMVDVSFPLQDMKHIAIDILNSNNTDKFVWLDHHKSAIETMYGFMWNYSYIKGLLDTKFAACELTWKYFFPNEAMPEIVRLLGRYDCFGHKDTDEEQKVLEFQYGARSIITNYEEAYRELCDNIYCENTELGILNKGKAIYQYLCTEAKQSYKNGFEIDFPYAGVEINNEQTVLKYTFICINKERFNAINFGIDYHKDGYDGTACFHYANGMWNFSLYSQTVDCSVIAKQYGGGGHKGAAGFIIKDINQIIK